MKPLAPLVLGFALACSQLSTASAEILVKSGDKIAFLGDSITQGGWSNAAGYVRLVMAGLEANGVKAEAIPVGISGNKSNDMLGRLERDVLSKKPQWMTLSCGVNDVWHGKRGVPLDDAMAASGSYDEGVARRGTYEKNIGNIVDQAQAAGIKVVLLTATVIKEQLDNKENGELAPYNEFLRALAREKKLPMADLNAMFQTKIKAANQPGKNTYTSDGVHMNAAGNQLMATGVLQAFGLNDTQIAKASQAWTALVAQASADAQAAAAAKAKADAAKKAATAPATPAPIPAPAAK
jgi:lysophospholipase L1-like esterase